MHNTVSAIRPNSTPLLTNFAKAKHQLNRAGISDFPQNSQSKKRDSFASTICFLDEIFRLGRDNCDVGSVICDIESSIDEYCELVLDSKIIVPPTAYIPSWDRAPVSIKLAHFHAILLLRNGGEHFCYTLFLHPEKVRAAFAGKKHPVSYYEERVRRELEAIGVSAFWQCVEIKAKKKKEDGGFNGFHHLHGGLHLGQSVKAYDIRQALRRAGGEFAPKLRASQARIRTPMFNNELRWAFYYCAKDVKNLKHIYGDRTFSRTTNLVAPAKRLYELNRTTLNKMRQ